MQKTIAVCLLITSIIIGLMFVPTLLRLEQGNISEVQAYAIAMKNGAQEDYVNGTKLVNMLLRLGVKVYWLAEPVQITTGNGSKCMLDTGDFIIPAHQNIPEFGNSTSILLSYIKEKSIELNATALEVDSSFEAYAYPLKNFKIAVYYGDGVTGGALEHIYPLEKMGFAADVITQADIELGNLQKYNILTFPGGGPYLNCLNQTQIERIKDYVHSGGGFLGTCGGSTLGVQLGLLAAQMFESDQQYLFSIMRGPINLEINVSSPVTFGYKDVFHSEYFWGPFISNVGNNVTVIASTYSATTNLQEYIQEIDRAYNQTSGEANINDYWGTPAIIAGTYGSGRVVLSTVHPEVLPESYRIFTNAIYFLSSGKETLIKTSNDEKETAPLETDEAAKTWNETTYSCVSNLTQTLASKSSSDKNIMNEFETANNEEIGSTGEYLGLYVSDSSSRSLQLSNYLLEMRDEFGQLEGLKNIYGSTSETPIAATASRNKLIAIENLQGRIVSVFGFMTNLEEQIRAMDIVGKELQTEEQNLAQIMVSSNCSLTEHYQELISLQKMESLTMNRVKNLVDYYLLRWSFQSEAILVEVDSLIYSCNNPGNESLAAILNWPSVNFIIKEADVTRKP